MEREHANQVAYYNGKKIIIAWKVDDEYTQIVHDDIHKCHEDIPTKDIEWRNE